MTADARELSQNSRVQMTQAITGLLMGKTPKVVATELQIPATRITRWQKDPSFRELYDEIESEMVTKIRTEAGDFIVGRLAALGPAAIEVLEEGLAAEKMSDRLNAAKSILSFQGVGKATREQAANVIPIEARIRERAVDGTPLAGD